MVDAGTSASPLSPKNAGKVAAKSSSSKGRPRTRKRFVDLFKGRRKSERLKSAHDPQAKLTLHFTSHYVGVTTQHEDALESVYFDQTATLSMPSGAPHDIEHYYEFRQQSRDSYTRTAGTSHGLTSWAQDGPYRPPYSDPQITHTRTGISFKDEPGFSTTSRLDPGDWLVDYDVYFRWVVTAKWSGDVWTSPEVHHQVTSEHTPGVNSAPVHHSAAGDATWTVQLPDRPND
jgi:hypothetical protein